MSVTERIETWRSCEIQKIRFQEDKRLRKNVGLSHGKGKLYVKSDVSELEDEKIKEDVQYLMIPLMTAERSWAYAMALKDGRTRRIFVSSLETETIEKGCKVESSTS